MRPTAAGTHTDHRIRGWGVRETGLPDDGDGCGEDGEQEDQTVSVCACGFRWSDDESEKSEGWNSLSIRREEGEQGMCERSLCFNAVL